MLTHGAGSAAPQDPRRNSAEKATLKPAEKPISKPILPFPFSDNANLTPLGEGRVSTPVPKPTLTPNSLAPMPSDMPVVTPNATDPRLRPASGVGPTAPELTLSAINRAPTATNTPVVVSKATDPRLRRASNSGLQAGTPPAAAVSDTGSAPSKKRKAEDDDVTTEAKLPRLECGMSVFQQMLASVRGGASQPQQAQAERVTVDQHFKVPEVKPEIKPDPGPLTPNESSPLQGSSVNGAPQVRCRDHVVATSLMLRQVVESLAPMGFNAFSGYPEIKPEESEEEL